MDQCCQPQDCNEHRTTKADRPHRYDCSVSTSCMTTSNVQIQHQHKVQLTTTDTANHRQLRIHTNGHQAFQDDSTRHGHEQKSWMALHRYHTQQYFSHMTSPDRGHGRVCRLLTISLKHHRKHHRCQDLLLFQQLYQKRMFHWTSMFFMTSFSIVCIVLCVVGLWCFGVANVL